VLPEPAGEGAFLGGERGQGAGVRRAGDPCHVLRGGEGCGGNDRRDARQSDEYTEQCSHGHSVPGACPGKSLPSGLTRGWTPVRRRKCDQRKKCEYPPVAGDEDAITRYLNVLRRKIEPKKRITKKSRTFSVPPEHQDGFDGLVKVSEAGGALRGPCPSLRLAVS